MSLAASKSELALGITLREAKRHLRRFQTLDLDYLLLADWR